MHTLPINYIYKIAADSSDAIAILQFQSFIIQYIVLVTISYLLS